MDRETKRAVERLAAWPDLVGKGDGVIVGADMTLEWLLPWWWENYQKHNAHKIAFVDLGLSLEMKEWCRERGELIRLRLLDDFVKEKSEIDPIVANLWDQEFGKHFWQSRVAWFKKPFACLLTPFQRTVWIDIDCEIRGSIQNLFAYADAPPGIAMARNQCPVDMSIGNYFYNSGVIAFRKNIDLLSDWANCCLRATDTYRTDDEAFSDMVEKRKIAISEIPPAYNWSRCQENDCEAIILHWHGATGKEVLRHRISLSSLDFS